MTEIETLIPHRSPFLFVDNLISVSADQIVGTKIFPSHESFLTGSFPEFAFVPGVALIESMAQCGGAGIKKLGLSNGMFAFANIERANFYAGVSYDYLFRMEIRNIKTGARLIKQSGEGYVDGTLCVTASWTCIRLGEAP